MVLTIGLVTLSTHSCFAEDPQAGQIVRFTNRQDGFTLTMPMGWREMPAGVAAALFGRQTGGGVYGYELAANSNSMAMPWVTVQVMRRGRIAGGYIAMLKNPEVRRRATLDMLEGQDVANQDVAEIGFDTNRFMLRFKTTRKNEDGIRLCMLEGLLFTDTGSITVACVTEAENYPTWAGVFSGIIDSFEVAPAVRYHPAPVKLAGAQFRAGIVLLIPGMLIAVGLLRLFSRRFSGQVMSDEI
jgi:hypothetical protein